MPTPVLIQTDTTNNSYNSQAWQNARTAARGVVTAYNALGLDPLTPTEFPQLFNDTENLIFDKITGGSLDIGGIPVIKSEALKIVQKPAGYDSFVATLEQFKSDALAGKFAVSGNSILRFSTADIASHFVLDGGGLVQYSTRTANLIAEYGKHYATTDQGIAVFQFLEDTVANWFILGLDQYFKQGPAEDNPISRILKHINRVNPDGTFTLTNTGAFTREPFPING